MNQLLECVFRNRHYDDVFLKKLNTEPFQAPKDTDKLCAILKYYHDTYGCLVLLTDFDMDGISCSIEGFAGLCELGFNVNLFVPDVSEGYGFTKDTIVRLLQQYPDCKCILTGDVGIGCYEGIQYARDCGVDVLVTDHHIPTGHVAANVVVDPSRNDDMDCFQGTSGSSVLYQVLVYYAEHYGTAYEVSQIKRLCVFAGFGTISDSMPLYYENRPLVRNMLDVMKYVYGDGTRFNVDSIQGHPCYRRAFVGLHLLLKAFEDSGHHVFAEQPVNFQEDFIGFYIAPLFNSIKRMHMTVDMAYQIFFGSDPTGMIQQLMKVNEERKVLVQEKFEDIVSGRFPQPWAPYIYLTDAESGIRGLLAQKLIELTGEPVFVVASEGSGYSGSGRCPSWYPFLKVAVSKDWFVGGHNEAFGIGFEDELGLDKLIVHLKQTIPQLRPDVEVLTWVPDFTISMFGDGDASVDVELLDDYLHELPFQRPFGNGFPEPVGKLCVNSALVEFSFMGSEKQHVRMKLPQGVTVVCWNQAYLIQPFVKKMPASPQDSEEGHMYSYFVSDGLPERIELSGKFGYNHYKGEDTIQFMGIILHEEEFEV